MRETDVKISLAMFAARVGCDVAIVNSGAIKNNRTSSRWLDENGKWVKAGFPDLVIGCRGLTLWLEVKTDGYKQSPDQVRFQKKWSENGMLYVVANSLSEGEDIINQFAFLAKQNASLIDQINGMMLNA